MNKSLKNALIHIKLLLLLHNYGFGKFSLASEHCLKNSKKMQEKKYIIYIFFV